MKIAYITAGAGGMYCGSCLRDNTLAAGMIAAGEDVVLIPTYTPTRTDEANVSDRRVFLGGINVYLQEHLPLFRRTPAFLDRILDSPRLLKMATRWGVRVDPGHLGALTVSMLRGTDGHQRKEMEKLVAFIRDEIRPDVVNLPNSLLLGLAPALKRALPGPVFCTLQGEDLFLENLPEPHRSESLRLIRSHSASVDAFIAVSDYCANFMSQFLEIDRGRISVVPLGINLDDHRPREERKPGAFTIGYLARIAPEKGLHVLCEAYRHLRAGKGLPPSRLVAAGYLAPEHRAYLEESRGRLQQYGLAPDFEYVGELDRRGKIEFLHSLDVLSVPTSYAEPKGIFLLEAMASGVPVVQPRRGSFPEIIETTGGGILVDGNGPEALAGGIRALWKDPAMRSDLARRGRAGVQRHFSAEGMSRRMLEIYRGARG